MVFIWLDMSRRVPRMKIEATFFGRTRIVNATPHNMRADEAPEEIMWVDNDIDLYGRMAPNMRHKKIALVSREDWLKVHDKHA